MTESPGCLQMGKNGLAVLVSMTVLQFYRPVLDETWNDL